MKTLLKSAIAAAVLAGVAAPALAQALPVEEVHAGYRETGSAKDWVGIYRPGGEDGTGRICAIYSRPTEAGAFVAGEPVEKMRGELAAFINWNDAEATEANGEVSFMLGTPVIEGAHESHELDIDGKASFDLVGVGDRLYVQPQDDAKVIELIRAGRQMTVTAALEDDATARDIYSLFGVVATTGLSKDGCK